MYSIHVVRVFNRDNGKTTYYKETDEGFLQRISKAEYHRLDSLSCAADTFYTTRYGAKSRNGKTLRFLYNPFKEQDKQKAL